MADATTSGPTAVALVRLLAGEDRRRVVAALILADQPLAHSEMAEASGLSLREVVDAVDRLVAAGLVHQAGDCYQLLVDAFTAAARNTAPAKPVANVLNTAIADGKLVQWPAKLSKRRVVLDHLVQRFDIGTRYDEQEVNDLLRPFSDDVATARRYLVDEQFLDRDHGEYWRCGGTV